MSWWSVSPIAVNKSRRASDGEEGVFEYSPGAATDYGSGQTHKAAHRQERRSRGLFGIRMPTTLSGGVGRNGRHRTARAQQAGAAPQLLGAAGMQQQQHSGTGGRAETRPRDGAMNCVQGGSDPMSWCERGGRGRVGEEQSEATERVPGGSADCRLGRVQRLCVLRGTAWACA